MTSKAKGVFLVAAKRTAFGKFGGAFLNTNQTELQTIAAKAAIAECGIDPKNIDSVIIGHAMSCSSSDGIYLPRHVSLKCCVPIEKPALGINRLCGSGFQSIVNAAHEIMLGTAKVVLTGGVENMSQAPFVVRNTRFGTTLGAKYTFEDSLWCGLTDSYVNLPMALTAENLAVKYNITRQQVEEFSLRSQQRWDRANKEGVFKTEITPVKLKMKGKEVNFEVDENPRPSTTMEGLAKLPALFKKNGVVTAGTASGISDGASAVIVASECAMKELNLEPLARLEAYSVVGVPPEIMGFGPVPAIKNLLEVTGKNLHEIDLFEINEAFAAQALACANNLCIDPQKLNVNGGAVALGHPLGASGNRIVAHLAHEMKRKKLKTAIGSACIGGGQGIAVLLESC